MKTLPLLLCLLMSCGPKQLRPGAVSELDSRGYDALIASQAFVDETIAAYEAGEIPPIAMPRVKKAVNLVIAAHNVARSSWRAYHFAAEEGQDVYSLIPRLERDLLLLAETVADLIEVMREDDTA